MKNKNYLILMSFMILLILNCKEKAKILIDGSSTVFPITEAVSEEYRKINSSVLVTVGQSGTGGGFTKFCVGEIHISNASREIKPSEVEQCKNNNIDFLEVPVAFDGLSIIVSKKNQFLKEVTVKELKHIFNSEKPAKSWNEVSPKYPNKPIKVYVPGKSSGTFDYFVETILGKHKQVRADATFSEDDNVLVTGIRNSKNDIGFFGLAYYEANRDSLNLVAVVNPKTKLAVEPTLDTVKNGDYFPLSRPLFIYVSMNHPDKKKIFEYVKFYLKNSGSLSQDVGYIPLPEAEYNKYLSKF